MPERSRRRGPIMTGSDPLRASGAGYGPFGGGFGDVFEDIFGDFFGTFTGRQRTRPTKGNDLQVRSRYYAYGSSLRHGKDDGDAAMGDCAMNAAAPVRPGEKHRATCPNCKGAGPDTDTAGFFQYLQNLQRCGGSGKIITDPCKQCKGQGKVKQYRSIHLKIPAGVDTGSRLRVSHEGEMGFHGGPRGDLYIYINVEEHPLFKRDGNDLLL